MFKPKLREYAAKALADRTVEVMTGAMVASVSPTRVTLKSGEELKAHTLVWGAGSQGNPLVQTLGLELQRGNRIGVGPDLTLPDHPEVYVPRRRGRDRRREDASRCCLSSARSRCSRESTPARRSPAGSRARRPSRSSTRQGDDGDDRARGRGRADARRAHDDRARRRRSRGARCIWRCCRRTRTARKRSSTGPAPRSLTNGPAGSPWETSSPAVATRRRPTVVDLARVQFATTSIYHFLFVPLTLGLGPLVAVMQTVWHRTGDEALAAADALLRNAVADQLRDRRRDRARAGVRVRDELVGLLEVRRQRLRRAAGDRGPGRVHARGDVPRALDLRLEPALAAPAPGDALDRRARHAGCRGTSSSSRTRGCSIRSVTRSSTGRRS